MRDDALTGEYPVKFDGARFLVPATPRRVVIDRWQGEVIAFPWESYIVLFSGLASHPVKTAMAAVYPSDLPDNFDPLKATGSERLMVRSIASKLISDTLDRKGRLVVPRSMLAAVGISDEAILVGVIDHLELWAPSAWQSPDEVSIERLAEKLEYLVSQFQGAQS